MRLLCLLVVLLPVSAPVPVMADTWQCPSGLFTDDAESVKEQLGCQKFVGSQVCGNGRNKFITPVRAGLSAGDCSTFEGSDRSPLTRSPQGSHWGERPLQNAVAETSSPSEFQSESDQDAVSSYKKLLNLSPSGPSLTRALEEMLKVISWE